MISSKGNGNPFQYFCLENSKDRRAWWATVHGVAKSWATLTLTLSLSLNTSSRSHLTSKNKNPLKHKREWTGTVKEICWEDQEKYHGIWERNSSQNHIGENQQLESQSLSRLFTPPSKQCGFLILFLPAIWFIFSWWIALPLIYMNINITVLPTIPVTSQVKHILTKESDWLVGPGPGSRVP